MIAILTDSYIHHSVVGVLCQILQNNTKYKIDTLISSMKGIGEHRNVIAKEFLKSDYEYLLMIDSDNPPPNNVLELIELDKDIIGLPTPINMNKDGKNNLVWNVLYKTEDGMIQEPIEGSGLEKVDAIGTGCVLIRRNVLEEIEHPFTTIRNADDLRTTGTDIAFCNRATEAGFEIYTHWRYKCSHYKEINLLDLI